MSTAAYEFGRKKAREQIDSEDYSENFYTFIGQQDVLFELTGEKLDPENEDSIELLDEVERGYWDEWDDKDEL